MEKPEPENSSKYILDLWDFISSHLKIAWQKWNWPQHYGNFQVGQKVTYFILLKRKPASMYENQLTVYMQISDKNSVLTFLQYGLS